MPLDSHQIRSLIKDIPDPEVPVITIEDLGILRDIQIDGEKITVAITPTYNGCPAMDTISNEIKSTLSASGYDNVSVKLVYSPVWTTDWLSEDAKERLRVYGISPPQHSRDKNAITGRKIKCPRCGSENTLLVSQFGSTACKALYKCENCREPFDYFKCH